MVETVNRTDVRLGHDGHESGRALSGMSVRCALITLPPSVDVQWWREQCREASLRATDAVRGRSALSGLGMRTMITYPPLCVPGATKRLQRGQTIRDMLAATTDADLTGRILPGARRVYVACAGRILWWHQALDVALLRPEHMRALDPAWQPLMRVGHQYLWVDALPEDLQPGGLPMPGIPRSWPLPFYPGRLQRSEETGELMPVWSDFSTRHR